MTYRIREDCRLCGDTTLRRVLDLPATPLANEFPTVPGQPQDEFPLWLSTCTACGHVQLPVVVDPERLFRDYVYVSGTSPVFVEHFRRYAEEMLSKHVRKGDLVVEIGSNDGTMLRFMRDGGARVLGIEPAEKIAKAALADGIESWPQFFDEDVATRIFGGKGRARLVVANNVFAHADDLRGIAQAVKRLLDPDGVFVFEVSYLVDVLNKTLFDTIYHEHLSYHSVEPLVGFFRGLGMSLVDAERVNTHGGSIRVTVSPRPDQSMSPGARSLIREERDLGLVAHGDRVLQRFGRTIELRKQELLRVLHGVRMGGRSIAAYGAPAKATTLLRTFGIEDMVDFVVDDSPLKQGRWLPGGHVPVYPSASIAERQPDYMLVLAWNFADSIIDKLTWYRAAGGTCIVPLPTVRIIDSAR